MEEIKKCQLTNPTVLKIKHHIEAGLPSEFQVHDDGSLRFRLNRLVIAAGEVRRKLLDECHRSIYAIHPGGTKMYQDMKQLYW